MTMKSLKMMVLTRRCTPLLEKLNEYYMVALMPAMLAEYVLRIIWRKGSWFERVHIIVTYPAFVLFCYFIVGIFALRDLSKV